MACIIEGMPQGLSQCIEMVIFLQVKGMGCEVTGSQDKTTGGISLTATRASTTVVPSAIWRMQSATRGRIGSVGLAL